MKSFALVLILLLVASVGQIPPGTIPTYHMGGGVKWQPRKPVVDVRDYGVVGDGQVATDCSITTGTAIVSCTTDHFVAGDIGKVVGMWDAGPSVFKSPNTYVVTLTSTILSYQDSKHVALADNAGNTANPSTHFVWGTNNVTTIASAREAANALYPNGYNLFFPAGYYLTPIVDFPCGVRGTFGPSAIGKRTFACTTATKNLTISGASVTSTTIENFKYDRGYATGNAGECNDSYYVCALIRFGTHSVTKDSDNIPSHWVNGVTIHDLTLIDVKNGNGTFFNEPSVINVQNTSNVEIYHTNLQGSSYPGIFAQETGEPLYVHDNVLTHLGWGGPAYSGSNAALNIFTGHSKVSGNQIYLSGQCFEGTAPFEDFTDNFCEGDDGQGNQPPRSVSPRSCLNVTSVQPGFWNSTFRRNTCRNYSNGGLIANGLGLMSNIVIDDMKFENTPGFSVGSGTEHSGQSWPTGETTTNVHGSSVIRNLSFTFDSGYATPVGLFIGGNREQWTVNGLTVKMSAPTSLGASMYALNLGASFPAWQPSTVYTMSSTGDRGASMIQPPMPNGLYYVGIGTGTGISGATAPNWTGTAQTTIGSTFADNGVTWKTAKKAVHCLSNVSISFPNALNAVSNYAILDTGMLPTDFILINLSASNGSFTNGVFNGIEFGSTGYSLTGFPRDFWEQADNSTPTTGSARNIQIKNGTPYSTSRRTALVTDTFPFGQYYNAGDTVYRNSPALGAPLGWVSIGSGWAAKHWISSYAYPYNALVQTSTDNGRLYAVTDKAGCTSGTSEPSWGTGSGSITNDTSGSGTCHWKESGASAQFILISPN